MPLLPPSDLVFTLPQLEEVVGQFCLDFKGNGDADAERCREVMAIFLGYFTTKSRPLNETSEAGEMLTAIVPAQNAASMSLSSPTVNSEFSSMGKIKSQPTTITRLKTNKVAPMMSQNSTALSIFFHFT